MEKQIFVPGVGQHDNIGDIILRRQLLDMLRPLGRLHIYVGASPSGYDEALGLGPDDIVYRSFRGWYAHALKTTIRHETAYVFKPGEIQLTLVGMKEHVGMLPLLALIRIRGGQVLRVGVGSRGFAPLPRALMAPSIALSNLTLWRDTGTSRYMRGGLMPDLAFGEGEVQRMEADPDEFRDVLVVSMRSDREYPPPAWLSAVREFAASKGLDIWAVTQVLRDNAKAVDLARDLGGQALEWDGTAHRDHEEKLRTLYRRTRVVVSDRLHVLVGSFTEGALPAAVLVDTSDKIARHFEAAGINGIAMSAAGASRESIDQHLNSVLSRSDELFEGLGHARTELAVVETMIEALLSRTKQRDPETFSAVGKVTG